MSDVYGAGWPQSADLGPMAMPQQQPFGMGAPAPQVPGQPMNIVPGQKPPQAAPGAAGAISPQLMQMIQQMGKLPFPVPQGAGQAPQPGPSPMFRALMPQAYG